MGKIDRFRIHKEVLTADQLDNAAATPKPVRASTLVAYSFDQAAPPFPNAATAVRPAYDIRSPSFVTDTPSGKAGDTALNFTTGQYVTVDDPDLKMQLDTLDPSFTLQAWVKFAGRPAA